MSQQNAGPKLLHFISDNQRSSDEYLVLSSGLEPDDDFRIAGYHLNGVYPLGSFGPDTGWPTGLPVDQEMWSKAN